MEDKIDESSAYIIKEMSIDDIPPHFSVAAIIRDNQVKIPSALTEIKPLDELLIFAKPEDAQDAESLFVSK